MASVSESLSLAVAHAIVFLTSKLRATYAPNTLLKLQMVLEANLTAHYAASWSPKDPVRGSGRRCMTLSPDCLPPRPIWTACTAANVQWFDWIALLGNNEFDLFVDPGCVAIRFRDQIINVWSDQPAPAPVAPKIAAPVLSEPMLRAQQSSRKTFAQQVLEEDREEEETIFNLLADEISAPTWMTPILTQFPMPGRSTSPMSSISEQSRCSSRSSDSSSSGFSFSSAETASSRTSAASAKTGEVKQSRRERARQARVFVDTSKTEVTPYDGGKTTVLTGGVMLGGGKPPSKPRNLAAPAAATAGSWRAARA